MKNKTKTKTVLPHLQHQNICDQQTVTNMSCATIKNPQDQRRVQQCSDAWLFFLFFLMVIRLFNPTFNQSFPFSCFRAGLCGCEVRSDAKHLQQAAREREADGGVRRLPAPSGPLEQGRRHHQGRQNHRNQTRARNQVRQPLDSSPVLLT